MSLVYPSRVLDTNTFKLVRCGHDYAYAILSHRWYERNGQEELTFRQLENTDLTATFADRYHVSRAKHINACKQAASDGWRYLWADTVCINKDSSEELRKSLNAMFQYYRQAKICYSYLNDVAAERGSLFASDDPARAGNTSEWFTRGWTLQELIAPKQMEFFDRNWKRIGAREDDTVLGQIAGITNIDRKYLMGTTSELDKASVATKLSWMAGRVTGEVEDIAYSLIGLLGVSMTPKYGEGTEAFHSLQIALLSSRNRFDESLFAWTAPTGSRLDCFRGARFDGKQWGLLAPSPDCFKTSKGLEKAEISPRHGRGFTWSNQGLTVSLPLKQTRNRAILAIKKQKLHFRLNCKDGKSQVVVELARVREDDRVVWKRIGCDEELGQMRPKKITGKMMGIDQGGASYEEITIAQPTYDATE